MVKNALVNTEEKGVSINMPSGGAWESQVGQSAYAASKAGVIGINLPAAREPGPLGIRMNAVVPGLRNQAGDVFYIEEFVNLINT